METPGWIIETINQAVYFLGEYLGLGLQTTRRVARTDTDDSWALFCRSHTEF